MQQYVANARDLLEKSRVGTNPFDGYVPEVPVGERLPAGTRAFVFLLLFPVSCVAG
jgi:UDP-sugar pyrophosphorylase